MHTDLREGVLDFDRCFASSRVGAALVDARGGILASNRALAGLLGYDTSELRGMTARELWDDSCGRVDHDDACCFKRAAFRRRDGDAGWVNVASWPVSTCPSSAEQTLYLVYEVASSSTARERIVRQAALASLGEMAAAVAHEVKNPLAGAGGALRIVQDRLGPGEREVVGRVLVRLERLNETVDGLLDFARPLVPVPQPVTLESVYEDAVHALVDEHGRARIRLVSPSGPCSLHADPVLLAELLTRLLVNAVEAADDVADVVVTARSCGDHWEIEVQDSGCGISDGVRERVFDPFFTTKVNGFGLGLSVARRIAENHGGSLVLSSDGGPGTSVILRLPSKEGDGRSSQLSLWAEFDAH